MLFSAQQGKGGCGKSVSTACWECTRLAKVELPLCIDTDPRSIRHSLIMKTERPTAEHHGR